MQVCLGEATAAKVMAWVKNKYSGKLRLKVGHLRLHLKERVDSLKQGILHAYYDLPME